MIRPTEIRTGTTGAGSGSAPRQRGYDKHWGNAICYITVDRNLYWWTRITINTGITLRENTDACSPFKQYQIIREDAMTIDLESLIPGNTNDVAKGYIYDLRAGKIITKLNSPIVSADDPTDSNTVSLLGALLQNTAGGTTGTVGTSSAYGAFVIERSNVELSRDDFSTIRVTLRSMGYGDTTQIVNATSTYDEEAGINAGSSPSSSS